MIFKVHSYQRQKPRLIRTMVTVENDYLVVVIVTRFKLRWKISILLLNRNYFKIYDGYI